MSTIPTAKVSGSTSTPQQGRKPSEDDLFYWEWARDTLKNGISLTNKVL